MVVLAIIVLISIPITIRVINNARENSAKRSIESYGRAVELAVGDKLLEAANTDYNTLSTLYKNNGLNIKYTGQEVTCKSLKMSTNNDIILRGCYTSNSKVYKYQDRHVTLQQDTYSIGDPITVNGIDFYVIEDSPLNHEYVRVLKKDAFTIKEINDNKYDKDGNSHVNKYNRYYTTTSTGENEAADLGNDVGGMAYYTNQTCHYSSISNVVPGCSQDYLTSDIKYVVDNWANKKFDSEDFDEV